MGLVSERFNGFTAGARPTPPTLGGSNRVLATDDGSSGATDDRAGVPGVRPVLLGALLFLGLLGLQERLTTIVASVAGSGAGGRGQASKPK